MRVGLVTALAALVLLVSASAAQAGELTRCVGSPSGCSGLPYDGDAAGLQQALDDADSNAEADTVRIGPGTYTAPTGAGFTYSGGELDIQGDGVGATIIKPSGGASATAFDVNAAGPSSSTISALGIVLASANAQTGLHIEDAEASGVRVSGSDPPGVSNTGVSLDVNGHFVEGSVDLPVASFGIDFQGSGNLVRDSTIRAVTGMQGTDDLTVTRTRITAGSMGLQASAGGNVILDDTLIHVLGEDAGSVALEAATGAIISASQMTLIGDPPAETGASAVTGGTSTTVNVFSSIFSGFATDLVTDQTGGGTATINSSYSRMLTTDDSAGGTINTSNNTGSDPVFVNAAAGDFHLRFDSPLIDTAEPGSPISATDLDGNPRLVDDADPPNADVGAFEYQRRGPTAGIVGPDSGQPGEPLTFTSRSSDPDPGDALTSTWSFGAQPATGSSVTLTFDKPGTYPVSLTVRDPTGQTASASTQVAVKDTLVPELQGVGLTRRTFRVNPRGSVLARRAKRGTTFRFSVSELTTVSFTIQRRTRGRSVGRRCRKATRRNRKRRRCIRYVKVKSFSRAAKAGANRLAFSGRYRVRRRTRKLTPARYRLTVRASDAAGNRSGSRRLGFRVVK